MTDIENRVSALEVEIARLESLTFVEYAVQGPTPESILLTNPELSCEDYADWTLESARRYVSTSTLNVRVVQRRVSNWIDAPLKGSHS